MSSFSMNSTSLGSSIESHFLWISESLDNICCSRSAAIIACCSFWIASLSISFTIFSAVSKLISASVAIVAIVSEGKDVAWTAVITSFSGSWIIISAKSL